MRTTLELDDRLHAEARRRAFEERRSLGDIISELALRGLELSAATRPKRQLGQYRGLIHIADHFDDTPPQVVEALDRPLT